MNVFRNDAAGVWLFWCPFAFLLRHDREHLLSAEAKDQGVQWTIQMDAVSIGQFAVMLRKVAQRAANAKFYLIML